MLPDRVSNPGPLTYESGALPIALRCPAYSHVYLRTMTKGVGQGSVRKVSVCYLNCCLHIAKLLYSLTVLKIFGQR